MKFKVFLVLMLVLGWGGLKAQPPILAGKSLVVTEGDEVSLSVDWGLDQWENRLTHYDSEVLYYKGRKIDRRFRKETYEFTARRTGRSLVSIQTVSPSKKILKEYRFMVIVNPFLVSEEIRLTYFADTSSRPFLDVERGFRQEIEGLVRATSMEEREHFLLAEEIVQRGYFDKGIREYEEFLNRYPKSILNELVLMRMGDAYFRKGEVLLNKGREFLKERKIDEGKEFLVQAKENFDQALKKYKLYLQAFPEGQFGDRVQYYIALTHENEGRAELILTDYEENETTVAYQTFFEDAIFEHLKMVVKYSVSSLADNSRLRIGEIYKEIADFMIEHNGDPNEIRDFYQRALAEFQGTIDKFPGSDAAGYALYHTAVIYDKILIMRNFQKAVEYYDRLYKEYRDYEEEPELGRLARSVKERMEEIKREYL